MHKEKDFFECFVAEYNHQIIGIALYFYAYFTWVGKSLYLDDLIVTKKYRNKGIGTNLLEIIIEHAKKTNCKRIRWQVLDWNQSAIDFYEKYSCTMDNEWINCDISLP